MAIQKKAWLSAIATFVLIAIIGLTFAFKPANSENRSARILPQLWYYNFNTPPTGLQIYDATRYVSSAPANCGGSSSVPCQISFTPNANYSTLAQYLTYQKNNSLTVNIVNYKDL